MAKKTKVEDDLGLVAPGQANQVDVERRPDEKIGRTLARVTIDPQTRNASLAMTFGGQLFGGDRLQPDIMQSSAVLAEEIERAMRGDLGLATRVFTSQAISLDALFTEMARRSGANMGEYLAAAESYMRLALKAQSACRSTLEALTRLHQPREQIVKHVHINQGAQAVVADSFHQHTGAGENGNSDEQCHATQSASECAALPGPDPLRDGVPIPGRQRKATVPHARGNEPGSA